MLYLYVVAITCLAVITRGLTSQDPLYANEYTSFLSIIIRLLYTLHVSEFPVKISHNLVLLYMDMTLKHLVG